jgi:Carbohydrate binding module (family 6)/Ricin-type beta-trefoil lectin domain-like
VGGDPNLSGIYKLQNRNSNLFLDVDGASLADRAPLIQWAGNDCACQQFRFTHLGNGTYTIQAVHSGKVLDVNEISTAAGAAIVQWPSAGGANQQFTALSTGDGFYKLRAKHSGQLIEVAGASTAGRARVQQWPDNAASCQQWRLVRAGDPVTPFSTTIQAEAFSNMQGVQVEGTSDAGGGQNVGYIDATDWLAYYNVTFPTSGQYTIEYRVASPSGSRLSADLNGGATQLGNVSLPATGGWQTWTTVSQTVNINAGTYNFGVYAQAGGWNLNWIRISKAGAARAATTAKPDATDATDAVEVYPNPVGSQLQLRSALDLAGSQYQLLDAYGRAQAAGTVGAGGTIEVAALRGGVYTLLIITKDQQKIMRRLLKQ